MSRKQRPTDDYFVCPHCGSDVPVGAASCRQCGASDDSGWSDDDYGSDGMSSEEYEPDADFDYDEFIRCEFPEHAAPGNRRPTTRWFTSLVVVIVLIAFLLFVLANW
ncbi:MAG: hypothetical protein H8E44_32155 [Planctomycetes bacterium]|nr:hypothetical protein [Planctomycetota bacterium]MBL7042111.1 hypothetical protein [Pirellulaceae bacterium]